ncbi:MAG: hypothetical protein DME58_07855 [Verrucomicrobia bacterium]|nr:MAG: hypothetical protein DMF05_05050 [Verrucomicrobiota bacterium]PYK31162.1 MAG: hypothetical protein DME58_07855 [Verrucomicrobiota bacterium]PYL10839.1 MAG: hypothetical protein DMF48_09880 [Verrucomicrobiota bacterium]
MFPVKIVPWQTKVAVEHAIISPIRDTRVSRVELIFRSALLCKSPLSATLLMNRAVDECSEAIFNSISSEQMTLCVIHCL